MMKSQSAKHDVVRFRRFVLENIRAYAEAEPDFISVGALTHSAKAADISMRIAGEPA